MATINDYKILNAKCRRYFELLEKDLMKNIDSFDDKMKERFGFYIYILESFCNIKDTSDIIDLITDTDFNFKLFGIKEDDFGIDAVYIDDDEKYINLFNFKFRETYNETKQQSINETFLSMKFVNAIISGSIEGFNGKIKEIIELIFEKLQSDEVWKLRLYVVSNDSKELDTNIPELKHLKEVYDLEIEPVGLNSIVKMMSLRPEPINCSLHLDKDSLFSFTESSLSSSKSYIIRISANELIRITCDRPEYRNKYNMEDFSVLYETDMDYNLLFDNVRGYVTRSKYNKNMFLTLKEEPTKFFMYNNGLTITADDIIATPTNANKKVKLEINNFQVVNGGQTLKTIHKFKNDNIDNIENYLSGCEILLRIFKTSKEEPKTRNRIAEYTNSQNAISNIDLKSLTSEQIEIEQYLDQYNIIYARKSGESGIADIKNYIHKISMEKFGQILFSIQGFPEKASNQKKQIFDKYYNHLFKEPDFNLSRSVEYISKYFEIKKQYDIKGNKNVSDQKIFYILYMDYKLSSTIESKIELLEDSLKTFDTPGKPISDARKLIKSSFKEYLDSRIM